MDEESKQYTAFTLGSMGLYKCESMPFRLCNTPPTFQRLMQNCLGELNHTYCLIYLDDVIVFSDMPVEHLHRICKVLYTNYARSGFSISYTSFFLSKLCLDPHVPGGQLHDVLGNIVRWCASSLLGSYVHQELI